MVWVDFEFLPGPNAFSWHAIGQFWNKWIPKFKIYRSLNREFIQVQWRTGDRGATEHAAFLPSPQTQAARARLHGLGLTPAPSLTQLSLPSVVLRRDFIVFFATHPVPTLCIIADHVGK